MILCAGKGDARRPRARTGVLRTLLKILWHVLVADRKQGGPIDTACRRLVRVVLGVRGLFFLVLESQKESLVSCESTKDMRSGLPIS